MARLVRACVSSSRTTMSPFLTRSPSLTPKVADHAARRVLHLLDVAVDHQLARRDDRARDLASASPQPKTMPHQDERRRRGRARDGARSDCWTVTVPAPADRPPACTVIGGTMRAAGSPRGWCCCGGCNTCSFGPNACWRPFSMTSTMSTPASAIGRWADHDDDAAARADAEDGLGQRLVALAVELELGSSSTTRKGSP